MPGVTIGDNCIIGCGTIVTHGIPANSIVVGVPGRVIESVGEYAAKHDDDFMHTKKMATDEKKSFRTWPSKIMGIFLMRLFLELAEAI